ncbi:YesL family protein, partial [Blautia wexlerae]|uniref:YesL family protein n=1 Tax=Blautia wexlerae TaxID=418240 RepID=UPI00156F7C9F
MERFLGQEGWLFRFLDRLWDLIVLNVLFIITCIPLFTVGAAISALYTVTMKGVRKEDSYIVRSYLSAFKENFKKSTILWLLMIGMLPVKRTIKNNKFLYRQPCYGWRYFMLLLYIAHDISLVSLHAVSF